ncbi:hypothetical protein [Mesorhizobium australafricanum]|uniref:Uncharacterized protein n=1 Tax=Mesorhizobium australafricanum TaxID=3072311 RepID=A0ABU4WYE2_9HYPH|nr:hypothetical protein [Mesorhizobium sp. VK3E]MDX8441070.1 hypothetical protein [Mesorhizobium sp. VK3E]
MIERCSPIHRIHDDNAAGRRISDPVGGAFAGDLDRAAKHPPVFVAYSVSPIRAAAAHDRPIPDSFTGSGQSPRRVIAA